MDLHEKRTAYVPPARHYANAPIREALIEIQIRSQNVLDLKALRNIEVEGYPTRTVLTKETVVGTMESGVMKASASQNEVGYRLLGDAPYVGQIRADGISLSRLSPYETWEKLREEADRLWTEYRKRLGLVTVTRLGVRYINQLDLPGNLRDFRDYVRSYPEVSTDLPQSLSRFFMQVEIPQTDINAHLILNEALVPPASPNLASVILDIDVFMTDLSNDCEGGDIWGALEILRARKNKVFEGCITDNTRELIS